MKARYLMYFSYLGTRFRSSEKLWLTSGRNSFDPESVQGMVEAGLLKLRSLNYPNVHLSSRTDGGVHALRATAHFDLEKFGSEIYDPRNISYELNKFFFKSDTSIFVNNILRVPDDFHARFKALSRTYLYRFAVRKTGIELPDYVSISSYIPIEEWRRCYFTRLEGFDVEKFREGAKYLVGYHDFTTFKKFANPAQYRHSRRELRAVTVRPGAPNLTSYSRRAGSGGIFDYWEVEFVGRAFVHNQIRRMVGTLLSVAVGKLPPEEIKVMLQVPSKHSWHTTVISCPPDGLYLCDVDYDPADLLYQPDQTERDRQSDSQCDSGSE